MSTEIQVWQVSDGHLQPLEGGLAEAGRWEYEDLEAWIASNPAIIGRDITIIGRQVPTKGGPLDLLGIDSHGDTVVIELKRDLLPREALAQAIDYASDVAGWSAETLSEICTRHTGRSLEEHLAERFPDMDLQNTTINGSQRILLVGFGAEPALERMIDWLSQSFGVGVNAILLRYVRTRNGDELLVRAAVVSEEAEQQRTERKKLRWALSDVPGTYPVDELRQKLRQYLSAPLRSSERMRKALIPLLLEHGRVSRDHLKDELVKQGMAQSSGEAGTYVGLISSQMSLAKNDFLRQVIGYESHPQYPWLKGVYFVRDEYRDLLSELLREIEGSGQVPPPGQAAPEEA